MVDHHIDRQNHKWRVPLDGDVPRHAGITLIVVAFLVAVVALLWSWPGSTIIRTYSGPQDTPIPTDNPVQPLRSGQTAQNR